MRFGYNGVYFCRESTAHGATSERCFHRSRSMASIATHRYGLYNSDGSRLDTANPSIPIKTSDGKYGQVHARARSTPSLWWMAPDADADGLDASNRIGSRDLILAPLDDDGEARARPQADVYGPKLTGLPPLPLWCVLRRPLRSHHITGGLPRNLDGVLAE